ncbi:MAG: cysteine desulfurase family protein, partial [Pseudomonadota bacterium]
LPFWREAFGNPHSTDHARGWKASEALEAARGSVAGLCGAKRSQLVFTSGATEANNLALSGLAYGMRERFGRDEIIMAEGEHPCVRACCIALGQNGFKLICIPLLQSGVVDAEAFIAAMGDKTALATAMLANNEIGTIQPIARIAAKAEACGALFHTDAAQACGRIAVDFKALKSASLSISAHKLYGPMGIGALILSRKARQLCQPIMYGGGQEGGLRPGTVPLPLAVGFARAADLARLHLIRDARHATKLRALFLTRLDEAGIRYAINGTMKPRLAGNLNLYLPGQLREELLSKLQGLHVSTGSACSSDSDAPSEVLRAIGRLPSASATALRLGFGRFSTAVETERAAAILIEAVKADAKTVTQHQQ